MMTFASTSSLSPLSTTSMISMSLLLLLCALHSGQQRQVTAWMSTAPVVTSRSGRAAIVPLHMSSFAFSGSSYSMPRTTLYQPPSVTTAPVPTPAAPVAATAQEGPAQLKRTGIYHIETAQQYRDFVQQHSDKLIFIKVFAPWCKACKAMESRFQQLAQDDTYSPLPVVWATISVANNKEFLQQEMQVMALPTIQMYVGSSLEENFVCGPTKMNTLRRKIAQLINTHVDPKTYKLSRQTNQAFAPITTTPLTATTSSTTAEPPVAKAIGSMSMAEFRTLLKTNKNRSEQAGVTVRP